MWGPTALGLRNPYRSTWDGGRLLVANVGGNFHNKAWESVFAATPGANFGWPTCEGGACGGAVFGWPHNNEGSAIIGGYVLRHPAVPPELQGCYVYADFITGVVSCAWLPLAPPADYAAVRRERLLDGVGRPVAIEPGRDGSILIALDKGQVLRVAFATAAAATSTATAVTAVPPPAAAAQTTLNVSEFIAGQPVAFEATGCEGCEYLWDVQLRHENHTHPVFTATTPRGSFVPPRSGHEYFGPFELTLTVRSPTGGSIRSTTSLPPARAALLLDTEPPGIPIEVQWRNATPPVSLSAVLGYEYEVAVPASHGACHFVGWDDGESSNARRVTIAGPAAYAARFACADAMTCLKCRVDGTRCRECIDGAGNVVTGHKCRAAFVHDNQFYCPQAQPRQSGPEYTCLRCTKRQHRCRECIDAEGAPASPHTCRGAFKDATGARYCPLVA